MDDDDLQRYGYKVAKPPAGYTKTRPWLNKRTGQTVQVPLGIDPGFGHNVGLIDRFAEMPYDGSLESTIFAGRKLREGLVQLAGDPDSPGFTHRFRSALLNRLETHREARKVRAEITAETQKDQPCSQRRQT